MKAILLPLTIDIDYIPELNHPLVQGFIDPEVEVSEVHFECIHEAIIIAEDKVRDV